MLVRLQKYMAECGAGSRRKCEDFIKDGRVSVDNIVVTEMGVKIDPVINGVKLDGNLLTPPKKIYIALNKPAGCVTTAKDQFGRTTVLDYVRDIKERVFPVGRLDYNSSGLLFLTNDGNFAYRLTHPKHNIEKTYLIMVCGTPSEEVIKTLREGVFLDDGVTLPAKVFIVGTAQESQNATLTVTVTEGRNRLVRRMMDAVGHSVLSLHRVSVGGVLIDGVKSGGYRHLSDDELNILMN